MSNAELQQAYMGDQQGYLFADLVRIINNGMDEKITDDHIKALLAENADQMECRGQTNDRPF